MLPFLKIKIESSQNNKLLLEGKAVLQLTYERKRLNQSFYYKAEKVFNVAYDHSRSVPC